jgi:tripartite-type tricarboxylate transporter receptor subunit TctC
VTGRGPLHRLGRVPAPSCRRAHDPARRGALLRLLSAGGATLGALAARGVAASEAWPAHPVRLLVPFAPGGTVDLSARLLAPRLAERLAQPVVVENRAGVSGNVGFEAVARARADGYTLLYAPTALATNPHVVRGSLDPLEHFAPVSMVSRNWLVLLVRADLPVRNVAELLALARARPGVLTCGTAGGNPQLAYLLFRSLAGVDLIEVPYKGMGPATADLAGGTIDVLFGVGSIAMPFLQSGRVRALALTDARRRGGWAEGLPALSEFLPGYVLNGWEGVLAPIGTPPAVVERLGRDVAAVVAEPAVRARLGELSLEPVGSTPAEFAAVIARDMARFAKLTADAGIRPQ